MYVIVGFDWHALPRGSVIVDVGGGIGSTTMLLANAFSQASYLSSGGDDEGLDLGFQFVIQDREVVVEMGEKVRGHFVATRLRNVY
jgi:ubiquinone/menaquinone biosynthesis C-methylase UbiE